MSRLAWAVIVADDDAMAAPPWKRELRGRCEAVFDFLIAEHGCRKRGRYVPQGFKVFYWNATTGVQIAVFNREPFTLELCRLPEGRFPPPERDYEANRQIGWFDAFEAVNLVTGERPRFTTNELYGNEPVVLEAYADALRGPCRSLLHDPDDPLWARLDRWQKGLLTVNKRRIEAAERSMTGR